MPAAAIVAGSVITGAMGAEAARKAASQQTDAADRATNAQVQAQREALQAQKEALAQQRADLQPWRNSGELANNRLASMMGLNGASTFTSDDPSYQFRFDEGQKAVDNGAASRGMSLSGAALKALTKYGQGMASTEYGNSFNRYKSMSDSGQNAAAGQGAAAMNYGNAAANGMTNLGNSTANNLMEMGNAGAASTIGQANAWSGAIGQGVNNYQQNQLMRLLQGGRSSTIPMQAGGGY